MSKLPDGIFIKALRESGRYNLFFGVPLLIGLWAGIMFIPWEAFFEENGAASWGIKTYEKLMDLENSSFPWVAVGLTVIALFFVWSAIAGALGQILNPGKSHAVKKLAAFGDPAECIRQFEEEAARSRHISWDKPLLIGTLNWLLIKREGEIELIPVDKILWAYDKSSATDGAVGFVFGQAGVISKRQQQLAQTAAERVLHFHVEGLDEILTISIPPFQLNHEELVDYLLTHNERMIWGYHPELNAMWSRDRKDFTERALAFVNATTGGSGDYA